jgi:hypothetical protein
MGDFFADLNSKLKPFGESISRQFLQVQQVSFLLPSDPLSLPKKRWVLPIQEM